MILVGVGGILLHYLFSDPESTLFGLAQLQWISSIHSSFSFQVSLSGRLSHFDVLNRRVIFGATASTVLTNGLATNWPRAVGTSC